jgi:Na+/H+ antiporter NhaC
MFWDKMEILLFWIFLKTLIMNYYIIIPVIIVAIALIVFLIKRNQKDKEDYEKFLNNNFTKKLE